MFIDDRAKASQDGWRRIIDVESQEHGLAMLSLLMLSYSPHDLRLGVGIGYELAWYARDIAAIASQRPLDELTA